MGGPDPFRRERTTFNKRTRTLLSKAHELATLAGADVYLVIHHPRATITYNSVQDTNWPPADKELETIYPHLQRLNQTFSNDSSDEVDHEMFLRFCQYCAYRCQLLESMEPQALSQSTDIP
ncbi:hypothetical protein ASPCAL15056 [Aspergillus calidoustus]|uniref:MADS-box domain-containing protein n=1 Tax=Aspergillus calidoustus TaxID=454130 RepID=A0A0U5CKS8_ASPCI|nr:hypothetical protein ASPCAL15056 [Aspergillus calidoustus]